MNNHQLLAEEGVAVQDPPASDERSGMRVRYSLLTSQAEQEYTALEVKLWGLSPARTKPRHADARHPT